MTHRDESLLHHRTAYGETLAQGEVQILRAWYAAQYAAEADLLGLANAPQPLHLLESQLNDAMRQLGDAVHRIQELVAENESVRRQINSLHKHLSTRYITGA